MNTWTTKNGTEIPVVKMELSHLINCLRMRLRQFNKLRAEINYKVYDFGLDFGFDGDMATGIGLCREEQAQLDKYDADITMFVDELTRRGCKVNDNGTVVINISQEA